MLYGSLLGASDFIFLMTVRFAGAASSLAIMVMVERQLDLVMFPIQHSYTASSKMLRSPMGTMLY